MVIVVRHEENKSTKEKYGKIKMKNITRTKLPSPTTGSTHPLAIRPLVCLQPLCGHFPISITFGAVNLIPTPSTQKGRGTIYKI